MQPSMDHPVMRAPNFPKTRTIVDNSRSALFASCIAEVLLHVYLCLLLAGGETARDGSPNIHNTAFIVPRLHTQRNSLQMSPDSCRGE